MKLRKIIPFILITKNKHLGMNIANDIEDLYTEDYISLVSRVKDLNKWQEIPCSSIRNLVLLMWQHSPS
jgi:hypothetical protein